MVLYFFCDSEKKTIKLNMTRRLRKTPIVVKSSGTDY